MENVKALTSKKFEKEFNSMLKGLEEAGYINYIPPKKVLNAKDYGVPQNRERVFVVSIRRDLAQGFEFPPEFDNGIRLKDILEDEVDDKYYISPEKTERLLRTAEFKKQYVQFDCNGKHNNSHANRAYYPDKYMNTLVSSRTQTKCNIIVGVCNNSRGFYEKDVSCCIDANYGKGFSKNQSRTAIAVLAPDRINKRQNGRRFKEENEPMFTLTVQDRHGILTIGQISNEGSQCGQVYSRDGLFPTLCAGTHGYCNGKVLINEGKESENELKFIGGFDSNKWIGNGENSRNFKQGYMVYDSEAIASTLNGNGGGLGGNSGLYLIDYRIRKLTPNECFRLQAFDDNDYMTLKGAGFSDTNLYKLAGNSIAVVCPEVIFRNLLKDKVEINYVIGNAATSK